MGIQYENAPITEALIDIRVELLPTSKLPILEGLHGLVSGQYPDKQQRLYVQGEFSFGAASSQAHPIGFTFRTKDGKQIFQARLDGFTFSRLRPYGNWAELRDQAKELWHLYRTAIGAPKIVRVAVRYINQINIINQDRIDYKDYFLTSPEVSPTLPQELAGFFMQLRIPQPEFGGMLILTQSAGVPASPEQHAVILDIDMIKEDPQFSSDDEVWCMLDKLRSKKNEFFEGCITDKARALFGERKTY